MCRVLEVSTSGYYAWLKRPPSRRAQEDQVLTREIKRIHDRSKGTYGAPRIHAQLAREGIHVGRKRVARLMQEAELQGVSRRKRYGTTLRQPDARPAPDLVERNFSAKGPDELWVADIPYVSTWSGWLYLAVVIDAWSRRVVGWAMDTHLRTQLVLDALTMAIGQRRPEAVIHHSDQGSQYTSLLSGSAAGKPASGPRWVRSAIVSITLCARASSLLWSVNCWTEKASILQPRPDARSLLSSKVGTIFIACTQPWTMSPPSSLKRHTPSLLFRQALNYPL